MKIGFLTNSLRVGGIETNLVLLTRELARRGHEVLVFADGGRLASAVTHAGGTHIQVPLQLRSPAKLVAAAARIREVCTSRDLDVLHVFSATAGVAVDLARLTCFRAFPPVIASVMGLQDSPQEARPVTLLRCFLTVAGSRRVLVISPAIDHALRRIPFIASRLRQMNVVGIETEIEGDLDAANEIRARLGARPDAPIIVTIGNLAPRKSHELFIDTASEVNKRFPDARFVIVGDGPLRKSLEHRADQSRLRGVLHFAGEDTELRPYYSVASLYVKPGVVEGFVGITLLQAQAYSIPVVAFDTEDVRIAVDHERSGVLVQQRTGAALAGAIVRLLSDRESAQRIGDCGRRRVIDRFSIGAIVDGLEQVYSSEIARA